jgi:hypothetical protein
LKEEKMALGKYAVNYEKRVDYDRLRKEKAPANQGSDQPGWLGCHGYMG